MRIKKDCMGFKSFYLEKENNTEVEKKYLVIGTGIETNEPTNVHSTNMVIFKIPL